LQEGRKWALELVRLEVQVKICHVEEELRYCSREPIVVESPGIQNELRAGQYLPIASYDNVWTVNLKNYVHDCERREVSYRWNGSRKLVVVKVPSVPDTLASRQAGSRPHWQSYGNDVQKGNSGEFGY